MMRLVSEAERFLLRASIGDELIVREQPGGPEIGGVRIIGPGEGTRVTLVIGLPEGLGDAGLACGDSWSGPRPSSCRGR